MRISNKTPSLEMSKLLEGAGLGKKKIVFHKDDTHELVCQKLVKAYPRLKNVGGFTLHRSVLGGYNRKITKIEKDWLRVKNIKGRKVSGSGILYIRPIQKDLELSKATNIEVLYFCFLFSKRM